MAGRKKKQLSSTEPLTPKALRRELKRLDRDLAKARSRRDQAQARLEALDVLGAQLAADLDAAVAAEAWVAEGAAVAEAAAEAAGTSEVAAKATETTGTSDGAASAVPTSAEPATVDPATEPSDPTTGNHPVPITPPRARRRRTPPATPPAESA